MNKFSINCRQHYLLCAKPQIIINGIKSNILRNSQYDTITTYSVFYKDSKGCFDFDLASANSVICSRFKSICSAITRSSYVASHRHVSKTEDYATASKMRDVISYKNCDEIEEDLCFGEVLKSDDENKKDELFYVIARFIEKDEFIDSFFGDIKEEYEDE